MDEGQASLDAAARSEDLDDYDDDWGSQGAVGLNDVERIEAKLCLSDFQDSFRAKKRKFRGADGETFEPATEPLNQEALTDPYLSTELVFVRNALATAQTEAKKARDQLVCSSRSVVS